MTATCAGAVNPLPTSVRKTPEAVLTGRAKKTVHTVVLPLVTVAGAQLMEVRLFVGAKVSVADCDAAFTEAVIDAVASLVIVPAATVNVALAAPAGNASVLGIDKRALVVDKATLIPAAGAALVSVMVQTEEPALCTHSQKLAALRAVG